MYRKLTRMADIAPVPEPPTQDPSPRPATPRWVKVSLLVMALLLVALLVALFSGGEHGPGRHMGVGANQAASPTDTWRALA